MDRCFDAVAESRHVRKEIEALEDHADLRAQFSHMGTARRNERFALTHPVHRFAVDPDHPVIDLFEGHEHAQHRRLARSGGANDRHDFARCDVEIQTVEHSQLSVALRHLVEPDFRRAQR